MNGIRATARLVLVMITAIMVAACATNSGGPVPTAPLTNTYWKLTGMAGEPVGDTAGDAQPHMILRDDGKVNGYSGCNRFVGEYKVQGQHLLFDAMASTRMACPNDSVEQPLYSAFEQTVGVFLEGKILKLLDDQGRELARFEAVALP